LALGQPLERLGHLGRQVVAPALSAPLLCLAHARAELARERQRREDLMVRGAAAGRFILSDAKDLEGQFVRKGQVVGYVARPDDAVICVIVTEDKADLVRQRAQRAEVRFMDRMAQVFPAQVQREPPGLCDTLPTLPLSTVGGGEIVVDPTDLEQMKVLPTSCTWRWCRPSRSCCRRSAAGSMSGSATARSASPGAWTALRPVRVRGQDHGRPLLERGPPPAGRGQEKVRGHQPQGADGAHDLSALLPPLPPTGRDDRDGARRQGGAVARVSSAGAAHPHQSTAQRTRRPARICRSADEKWRMIVQRSSELSRSGRPVLIGTRSVAASQTVSDWLTRAGLGRGVRTFGVRLELANPDGALPAGMRCRVAFLPVPEGQ
jgi:hypothetical protein